MLTVTTKAVVHVSFSSIIIYRTFCHFLSTALGTAAPTQLYCHLLALQYDLSPADKFLSVLVCPSSSTTSLSFVASFIKVSYIPELCQEMVATRPL